MTNSSVHALLWHTLSKVPKSPWELVQLYPSVTPPRTSVCKEMLLPFFFFFICPSRNSPYLFRSRLKSTRRLLSLIGSDSGVKMQRAEAIRRRLAMAPARDTFSPQQ